MIKGEIVGEGREEEDVRPGGVGRGWVVLMVMVCGWDEDSLHREVSERAETRIIGEVAQWEWVFTVDLAYSQSVFQQLSKNEHNRGGSG